MCVSHSIVSELLRPHGLYLISFLCPWNSLGKNTGVGNCFILQRIFLFQGSNPDLPHCRQIFFYHWATKEAISRGLQHSIASLGLLVVTLLCLYHVGFIYRQLLSSYYHIRHNSMLIWLHFCGHKHRWLVRILMLIYLWLKN